MDFLLRPSPITTYLHLLDCLVRLIDWYFAIPPKTAVQRRGAAERQYAATLGDKPSSSDIYLY